MKFVPYVIGDVVEFDTYPGVFFEIASRRDRVFANRQFYNLKIFGIPGLLANTVARDLRETLETNDNLVVAEESRLRRPTNEMEVIAIAWAQTR